MHKKRPAQCGLPGPTGAALDVSNAKEKERTSDTRTMTEGLPNGKDTAAGIRATAAELPSAKETAPRKMHAERTEPETERDEDTARSLPTPHEGASSRGRKGNAKKSRFRDVGGRRILGAGILAAACLAGFGCSKQAAMQEKAIEEKATAFERMGEGKGFRVLEGASYVGGRETPYEPDAPFLSRRVSMRSDGTLAELVEVLCELLPVPVQIQEEGEEEGQKGPASDKASDGDSGGAAELASMLGEGFGADAGQRLKIRHEGSAKGLLEQIAAQSGYAWEYDGKARTIVFSKTAVKTFAVHAIPGKARLDTLVTNKTRESGESSVSQSSGRTGGAQGQSSQSSYNAASYDAWDELVANAKILLSKDGKLAPNPSAGTITVRDRPKNVRAIGLLVEESNARYERQVSLKINVYSLDLSSDGEGGIDVQALFEPSGGKVAVAAGALSLVPGASGTASATIVKGELLGSQGVLKALRRFGRASQITSGGLVVRNNVPAPLQAIRKTAYLASMTSETTNYGRTSSLTPGEVSTGFSMTVVPHILDNRKVALSCNVSLSYLEGISEFSSGDSKLQLPQTSARSFGQSATMCLGQTLVLAGWQQAAASSAAEAGLLRLSGSKDESKSLIVITIAVENAAPES